VLVFDLRDKVQAIPPVPILPINNQAPKENDTKEIIK